MSLTISQAQALHARYPVVDVHTHWLINGHYLRKDFQKSHKPPLFWNPLRNMLDLPRIRKAGITCPAFTIYVPIPPLRWSAWKAANRIMDTFDELVKNNPNDLVKTDTAEGIHKAHQTGHIAAMLTVEGGHIIGKNPERLEHLRNRGVRMLTLTHLFANRICDGHVGPSPHKGLSAFGRDVIKTCESLGIVVDLAHAGEKAFYQALDTLQKPPVVSHTGLRGPRKSVRYLSDDQVKALAQRGGALGLMLCPWYHDRFELRGSVDKIADAFCKAADLVGNTDHLMLGTDMDGYIWLPKGMRDAADLPKLTQKLVQKGFKETYLKAILGHNALRILSTWE